MSKTNAEEETYLVQQLTRDRSSFTNTDGMRWEDNFRSTDRVEAERVYDERMTKAPKTAWRLIQMQRTLQHNMPSRK